VDAPDLIEGWLVELERVGCIRRYSVDGASYLDIPAWSKHQRIDRPSPSKLPPFVESSANSRRAVDEHSSSPRRALPVGEGEDLDLDLERSEEIARTRAAAPLAGVSEGSEHDEPLRAATAEHTTRAEQLGELWKKTCPSLPVPISITPKRITAINAALDRVSALGQWEAFFARLERSAFCRGQNARGWKADLDWALKPDTWTKTFEGKYDDRVGSTPGDPRAAMRERALQSLSLDIDLR
jgi:hypothetical protein